MVWQQKNKYAIIVKEFTHSQIPKWNGTTGYPIMTAGNIGILNEETKIYDFKEVDCSVFGEKVVPCFLEDFVLHFTHIFKTVDSFLPMPHDQEEKNITERFEIRLLKATSQMDVDIAKMYYEAAQIDRLSIKQSLYRLGIINSNGQ